MYRKIYTYLCCGHLYGHQCNNASSGGHLAMAMSTGRNRDLANINWNGVNVVLLCPWVLYAYKQVGKKSSQSSFFSPRKLGPHGLYCLIQSLIEPIGP